MCLSIITLAILASHQVQAHYLFGHLIVNGTKSKPFQYVRDVTANETYDHDAEFGRQYPLFGHDLDSTNFTCGRDAIKFAQKTATATIIAGTEVGLRVIPKAKPWLPNIYNDTIFHDGPANVYLAKPPSGVALESWAGDDGEWFKIAGFGAINSTKWVIDHQEGFYPYTQFYVNCAHVNIIGPGGGMPSTFARFPGAYNYTEIDERMNRQGWLEDHTKFTGIGPSVWTG
ncbi:hypothetical protein BDV96DRAFT_598796 [Lophiotrema nucula]|uniref:lytic cellulose monooxygenase (C4-dehydrogenating) n=1 Tax=Lophiotrema nucula TaxID=690887 RepID=A0A6A5Z9A3_9PLEO|nr:hypothetical protein BDV96DRAFT_598796 [Lophiotrema nucula]